MNGHHFDHPVMYLVALSPVLNMSVKVRRALGPSDLASPAGVSEAQLQGVSGIFNFISSQQSDDRRA